MKSINSGRPSLLMLIAGDILAVLLFVVVGRASHHENSGWLFNVVRIASPFLLGWFVVAPFTGAYRLPLPPTTLWLRRSALTWLLGIALGLLLRGVIFRDAVPITFAIITLIFTGIFLLGWRTVFAIIINRARSGTTVLPSAR